MANDNSKSVFGGIALVLIVVSLGLKFLNAYNKQARNNPPAQSYRPSLPPAPPPVVHEPLEAPSEGAPVVTGSELSLTGWSVVTHDSERFRLYAPPDPTVTDAPKNAKGEIPEPGRRWQWTLADGAITLLAEYRDQSKVAPLAQLFTTDSLMDSMVAGYIKNGAQVTRRPISLRGHPGREAAWQTEKGRHMFLRLFISGTDRYLVLASADEDHIDDPAIDAFIDSFDFVKSGSK